MFLKKYGGEGLSLWPEEQKKEYILSYFIMSQEDRKPIISTLRS